MIAEKRKIFFSFLSIQGELRLKQGLGPSQVKMISMFHSCKTKFQIRLSQFGARKIIAYKVDIVILEAAVKVHAVAVRSIRLGYSG